MVQYHPPPDFRSLLPPLLACLPTAFASPRPPPALLPLLSPILRQRVQLLSATAESPSESWLPLLCREPGSAEKSERLARIIESEAFELHPVSGEIEFRDVNIKYTRLDEETLQAKVAVVDLDLDVVYLWCQGDQEGGGDGWRVCEVTPLDNGAASDTWWTTVGEAEEKAGEQIIADALRQRATVRDVPSANGAYQTINAMDDDDDDNDDDYWAQYDNTPARTPAPKRSPQPVQSTQMNGRGRTKSEADYYAQYAQVQPEMDNDDPSEDRNAIGESSLNGDIMASSISHAPRKDEHELSNYHPTSNGFGIGATEATISQPSASSPTLVPEALSRMEDSAELLSNSDVAIRQHISTSMKSLFRLARSTGMERQEFDRLIRTELDTLEMMDLDG